MSNWISVKDRAPDKKSRILVWDSICKSAHEVKYDYDAWNHVGNCYDGWTVIDNGINFEFSHWMALPDPPVREKALLRPNLKKIDKKRKKSPQFPPLSIPGFLGWRFNGLLPSLIPLKKDDDE